MSRAVEELVQAFVKELGSGDVRRLEPFLDEDVGARFEEAGQLIGRHAVTAFWRRLFQSYPRISLQVRKIVSDGTLVIAELVYALTPRHGRPTSVRTISLFEIQNGLIVSWSDHADLSDVTPPERDLWRRLGTARW